MIKSYDREKKKFIFLNVPEESIQSQIESNLNNNVDEDILKISIKKKNLKLKKLKNKKKKLNKLGYAEQIKKLKNKKKKVNKKDDIAELSKLRTESTDKEKKKLKKGNKDVKHYPPFVNPHDIYFKRNS